MLHPRWLLSGLVRFTKLGSYASVAVAGGLCVTTGALVFVSYVATREWRQSIEALMLRRQAEAAGLVAAALDGDMKGAASKLLVPVTRSMLEEEPPHDLLRFVAQALARFPYPESLIVWRRTSDGAGLTRVFNRSQRRPRWNDGAEGDDPFPIVRVDNPEALGGLVTEILRRQNAGRLFAVIHTALAGVPYQVIVHYLDDGAQGVTPAFAAFTVNLEWVRAEYFSPILQQVSTIGGNSDVLSFSIGDERNEVAIATGPPADRFDGVDRRFSLLFIDEALLSLRQGETTGAATWSLHVRSSTDQTASAADGARRRSALIAISALVSLAALIVALRAIEAKAAFASMQSEFVAAVTHELKTPVALVRLVGDTLASGRPLSSASLNEYARLLLQEAKRLSQSIDQLLTYARYSETQKLDASRLAVIDFVEVLHDALEMAGPALSAAGFAVQVDVPHDLPPVKADRLAIVRVIANIVDNAIKYRSSSPSLQITGRADARFVRVTFADRGIGIAREEIPHVIERFYRGRNASATGSGLGLAIAKRILDQHKGQIHIRSAVDVGTEVEFLLPTAGAS